VKGARERAYPQKSEGTWLSLTNQKTPREDSLTEMLKRELRSLLSKMIRDHKGGSNKQVSEIRKLIHDLDKKVSNMEEKFSKEVGIMKNNQVET
jgi:hypothetical protein